MRFSGEILQQQFVYRHSKLTPDGRWIGLLAFISQQQRHTHARMRRQQVLSSAYLDVSPGYLSRLQQRTSDVNPNILQSARKLRLAAVRPRRCHGLT